MIEKASDHTLYDTQERVLYGDYKGRHYRVFDADIDGRICITHFTVDNILYYVQTEDDHFGDIGVEHIDDFEEYIPDMFMEWSDERNSCVFDLGGTIASIK